MKTKILSLLVILAITVASCQKDEADKPVVKQDVSFGIEHVDPMGLKDDILCPDDLTPYKAVIDVYDVDNDETLNFDPLVFFLNGKWYTQAIKLAPGDYKVTKFLLVDDSEDYVIIMATPAKGSDYAVYVEEGVAIDFEVEAFKKVEIAIDVLCYEEAKYTEFGFFWFQVDRIVVREVCFFGDICILNPEAYAGSIYELQGIVPVDAEAAMRVIVKKDGVEVPGSPFDNLDIYNTGAPLCVLYPDNLDVVEVFTFEVQVWVPSNIPGIFVWQTVATYTTTDGTPLAEIGDEGIVDFAIGACSPWSTNIYPWLPVPTAVSEKGFGFRVKGAPGPDIYLGVGDLGNGNNRVQADAGNPLPDGTYPLTFNFNSVTGDITLAGPANVNLSANINSFPYTPCGIFNALKIMKKDHRNNGAIELSNVLLNGNPIGPFPFFDYAGTPGYLEWVIPGDFTQSFTLTADLQVQNLNHNESLSVEVGVVCY